MHRVVFMGTPAFAVPVLQALLETQKVVGVVTQPDRPAGRGQRLQPSPVKVLADEAGVGVYQPISLKAASASEPLQAWLPEVIVVAAYGQILRAHVLNLPPLGCINVHASLLPRWRGASPIQHAILAGDEETGISLMRMEAGLDTGPVYVRRAMPILPGDTAATLHDRLADLGGGLIREHLDDILTGRLTPVPQDDAAATYAPLIRKEDGHLSWSEPAVALARRVRAMTPWPGAVTNWQGRQLKILEAAVVETPVPAAKPGTVLPLDDGAVVQTGDGGLALVNVQVAGKRATPISAFLLGQRGFLGSVLGQDSST